MSLVSVVIPSYNRGELIERAVRSVLAQTRQDFETIIVDDGSTDDTSRVVAALAKEDQRIYYLQHDTSRGAQAARNTGIRAAQGEWIAFLDSDDQWLPNSLETRLEVAEKEQVKVVHSDCYVVGEDGNMDLLGVPPIAGWIYRDLLAQPGPVFPTLLVTRKALEKIGYLDEQIVAYQEWDTAIRLAKHYRFGFVAEPTFIYNCQDMDTISKDLGGNALGYEQVFRKHILSIIRHAGPRALARHYQSVASLYQRAGDQHAGRRCTMMAWLWWPSRPRAIWHQFSAFFRPERG
jgi:glycosyltransferase involved in cell wall biosynthesis